jgi:hypothetical protein
MADRMIRAVRADSGDGAVVAFAQDIGGAALDGRNERVDTRIGHGCDRLPGQVLMAGLQPGIRLVDRLIQ